MKIDKEDKEFIAFTKMSKKECIEIIINMMFFKEIYLEDITIEIQRKGKEFIEDLEKRMKIPEEKGVKNE